MPQNLQVGDIVRQRGSFSYRFRRGRVVQVKPLIEIRPRTWQANIAVLWEGNKRAVWHFEEDLAKD